MNKWQASNRKSVQRNPPVVPKTLLDKKPYNAPCLFEFGSLAELTQMGPMSGIHGHMGHMMGMGMGHAH